MTIPDTHVPDFREDRKDVSDKSQSVRGMLPKSQIGLQKKEKSGPQ